MTDSYRFGRFEVSPATRQVVDGELASLGARAFDVLLVLIERRDRVVPKNELLDLVWPGVVVEENNLQVQVSARCASCSGRRAIATIPGRGYQFTSAIDGCGRDAAFDARTPVRRRPNRPAPRGALPAEPAAALSGATRTCGHCARCRGAQALVTVVGAGGIGKTGWRRRSRTRPRGRIRGRRAGWSSWPPVADPARVPAAVADGLGADVRRAETRTDDLVESAARPDRC